MKFIISRSEFAALLAKLQHVVSIKATIPVLSNLLLEASNNELVLSATDLTVGLRCYTEAKIIRDGSTTLPARRFAQLIRELTAVNLEVSTNPQSITEIVADSSRFKMHGMGKQDFPQLPDFEGAARFVINQTELKQMLRCVSVAVAKEDSRLVLMGVKMEIADSLATFVATDAKRLALCNIKLEIDPAFKGVYVIPLKAIDEIIKNLSDDGEETATVYLLENRVAVESNRINLTTQLLTGGYPDYQQVIPKHSAHNITLHRQELISLLRQVALFTSDSSHSARFSFSNGELTLAANSTDIGEGRVTMAANYQGDKLDIAFNPRMFLEILEQCRNETISFGITDAYNPGVIVDQAEISSSIREASPLFVIMPMRLNEA